MITLKVFDIISTTLITFGFLCLGGHNFCKCIFVNDFTVRAFSCGNVSFGPPLLLLALLANVLTGLEALENYFLAFAILVF